MLSLAYLRCSQARTKGGGVSFISNLNACYQKYLFGHGRAANWLCAMWGWKSHDCEDTG